MQHDSICSFILAINSVILLTFQNYEHMVPVWRIHLELTGFRVEITTAEKHRRAQICRQMNHMTPVTSELPVWERQEVR